MELRGFFFLLTLLFSTLDSTQAQAAGLEIKPIVPGVHAVVGEMVQRSPENLANNATFGVVETKDGLVLIDPGGSYKGAQALHAAVRSLSNAPVLAVINTGGQDHRWLGNGYWKEQGATIYASEAAVEDHKDRADGQFAALRALLKEDGLAGTEAVYADQTFASDLDLNIGGVRFVLRHAGQAHTPGDSFVWLPDLDVVFTGDIVYLDRMLGVGPQSNSKSWLEVFAEVEALGAAHLVPGHGYPATTAEAIAETKNYLLNLRTKVGAVLGTGGSVEQATLVDQSAFMHLKVAEQIARRNAQAAFLEMEWE